MRIAELVSLGDRRLVAVVELDGRQFLLGCGPSTVTLLAQIEVPGGVPGAAPAAVPNAAPAAVPDSETAPRSIANRDFSGVLRQALSANAAAR